MHLGANRVKAGVTVSLRVGFRVEGADIVPNAIIIIAERVYIADGHRHRCAQPTINYSIVCSHVQYHRRRCAQPTVFISSKVGVHLDAPEMASITAPLQPHPILTLTQA